MELVDTHCHIQSIGQSGGERVTSEKWAHSELTRTGAVTNAAKNGVTRLVCVGCDLEDSRLAAGLAAEQENCFASIGIHPHEAKHFAGRQRELEDFAGLISGPKVVAVGECGFDFYYSHSPEEAQAEVLKFQIELALRHDKPLIFHVRDAFDDFWPVFDSYEGIRGVVHSYTDSAENLTKILERGLYVGVNGITTFAKDPSQLEVYKSVPLDRLLLETDAPFLTPAPHRREINEPRQIKTIAVFLAQMRNEKLEDLAVATTSNARKLFGI